MRRIVLLIALACFALLAAEHAAASESVARKFVRWQPEMVGLKVNGNGMALVTYRQGTKTVYLLVWGAINARRPDPDRPQVEFRRDYSGGWGAFGRPVWRTFVDRSRPYDGPTLPWFVKARKAPDGSYWALQTWRRSQPCCGQAPKTWTQRSWELRVSHWTGQPAKLEIWTDWVLSGRYHHLFGRYTFRGFPVYGFRATSTGEPLDGYGRNVYVDTYNSSYGAGWKRERGFLTHRPRGNFCFGFYRHKLADGSVVGPGNGERYRATVMGPGVTPDAKWTGPGLHDYDSANPADVDYEQQMNALGDQIAGDDRFCQQH